jgi:hypothetical protein
MLLAAMCAAQMPPGHGQMGGSNPPGGMQGSQGVVPSNRSEFGTACGIQDSSVQSAIRLTRSAEGMWSTVSTEKRPEPTDSGVARVWREHNWMVDIHEAPGRGMNVTKMHTGQMCFNAQGRILHMTDRYMDMPNCNCMRFTDLSFDEATGRVIRREQHFLNASTGEPIAAPESVKEFPETWGFRRLDQLPFYSLVKK